MLHLGSCALRDKVLQKLLMLICRLQLVLLQRTCTQ
jgi:hypothetical protein